MENDGLEYQSITMKYIYKYQGQSYEILCDDEGEFNEQRQQMILNDFLHCEKTGDWNTIKNRMTNGIKWGWLKEVV